MYFSHLLLPLSLAAICKAAALPVQQPEYPVHDVLRYPGIRFENLAIRSNGQILTTSTGPNASVYQVDPTGVLPMALIHYIPDVDSAVGITEGPDDVFYVASSDVNMSDPFSTTPASYNIWELDVNGVAVKPDGTLTQQPVVKHIANLPDAALLNGIALARRNSDHLLVADSFRGLVWNVNVKTGAVGVALNDSTTKGPAATGSGVTGINGLKVSHKTMYWTNTGLSSVFKVPIDEFGQLAAGVEPTLLASNVSGDDLGVAPCGTAYVAGPLAVLTRVKPNGEAEIIAGTLNSTASDLGGPTSVAFGRLPTDHRSIYITKNGGLLVKVPNSEGIARIDLF